MKYIRTIYITFSSVLLVACAPPGVEDTSEADREAIKTVTEQSREAYMARDWNRFSGHFTEDAIWMPDNVLPLTGKAAWWSFVEQFWDSTAVVEMDLVSEEIIVAGDWAFQRMTETTVTVRWLVENRAFYLELESRSELIP